MKENGILFLKEKDFVATVFYVERCEEVYSLNSELNKLAKRHFLSLSEYRKLVRRQLDLKNKIPIYFSDKLFLFYLKIGNESYWINYFNILKICYDENIVIIFKNGYILKLDTKRKNLIKELGKIDKVLNYKKSFNS
jgi:hypothetical protein